MQYGVKNATRVALLFFRISEYAAGVIDRFRIKSFVYKNREILLQQMDFYSADIQ